MRALSFALIISVAAVLPALASDSELDYVQTHIERPRMAQQVYSYTDKNGISWICRWEEIPQEYRPIPKKFEALRPE